MLVVESEKEHISSSSTAESIILLQASFFSLFFSVSRNGHKDMDQRLHWKSVII